MGITIWDAVNWGCLRACTTEDDSQQKKEDADGNLVACGTEN